MDVGAHTRARWRGRFLAEQASAEVMASLASRLGEQVPDAEAICAGLRAAAADERRHAGLCAEVLARLGEPAEQAEASRPGLPPSESGDLGVALLEHVVFLLCAGETIAAAMLREAAREATAPGVAALLDEIAKDEAGHGLLGWAALDALVATLPEAALADCAQLAPRQASRAVVAASLVGPVDADSRAWGLLSAEQAQAIAHRELRTRIGPGLAARGLWAPRASRGRL